MKARAFVAATCTALLRALHASAADGPLVIAIAAATLHGLRVLDLATWFFVSESLSLYVAIAILALVSGRPSRNEKWASLGIMAACIAVVAVVCGWSLWGELAASPVDAIVFGVGLVESTAVACVVLTRDVAAREQKAQMVPMIAAMVLWIAACAAGAIARVSMS